MREFISAKWRAFHQDFLPAAFRSLVDGVKAAGRAAVRLLSGACSNRVLTVAAVAALGGGILGVVKLGGLWGALYGFTMAGSLIGVVTLAAAILFKPGYSRTDDCTSSLAFYTVYPGVVLGTGSLLYGFGAALVAVGAIDLVSVFLVGHEGAEGRRKVRDLVGGFFSRYAAALVGARVASGAIVVPAALVRVATVVANLVANPVLAGIGLAILLVAFVAYHNREDAHAGLDRGQDAHARRSGTTQGARGYTDYAADYARGFGLGPVATAPEDDDVVTAAVSDDVSGSPLFTNNLPDADIDVPASKVRKSARRRNNGDGQA